MSVELRMPISEIEAKISERLIQKLLKDLRREVARHPNPLMRWAATKPIHELENLLK